MNLTITNALILLAVAFSVFAVGSTMFGNVPQAGASPFANNIGFTATTSTSVNVTTTSTRILATTTNPLDPSNNYIRVYATICNPSATLVHIRLHGDRPATASSSAAILATGVAGYDQCYEITDRNQYLGSVQAITATGNAHVNVNDYVQ